MQNKKTQKYLTCIYDIFFAINMISLVLLQLKLPALENLSSILTIILLVFSFILTIISYWLFHISGVKRQLLLSILFLFITIYVFIVLI